MSDINDKDIQQGAKGIKPTIENLIKQGIPPTELYHIRYGVETEPQHDNWVISEKLDLLGFDVIGL